MKDRKKVIESLRTELARCILISEEEKKFWMDNSDDMPTTQLEAVLAAVMSKNEKVDGYLSAALANDPDQMYLSELKNKLQKIKKEAFRIEEESQKGNLEEELTNKLDNA